MQKGPEDESKRAEVEQELGRLRQLNRARIQFINTAAHELATPLTPVSLQVSMLARETYGELNPRQKRAVEIIDRNVERLFRLVKDIVEVARLESERPAMKRERADLTFLVKLAAEQFQDRVDEAGLRLRTEIEPDIHAPADEDRIKRVVSILLSNAMKFTPRGGSVDVRLHAKNNEAIVEVQDTGIGIREQDFPRLFQPFSQLHDTMQMTAPASGLGLTIAMGLVGEHGGRMWADSPGPGKGSTFGFALPQQEPPRVVEPASIVVLPGSQPPKTARKKGWTLFYFKCPDCGSRDIQVRLIRNRYECDACGRSWR